jgi:hypothetical protein
VRRTVFAHVPGALANHWNLHACEFEGTHQPPVLMVDTLVGSRIAQGSMGFKSKSSQPVLFISLSFFIPLPYKCARR